uniref:F-box/LRR-repeat protein 7-like isoform X1 n=2 Tax=Petromyzon marinus TaxID=7757 RepID=A0AAJ7X3M0_PETMA|nr:F-box/LRR-repeat protein 7-like isoform X1 [Petromyzon marinus]
MQHRPLSPSPCNHQRPLSPTPACHRQNFSCPSSQQKAMLSPHFGQDLSFLYPAMDNYKVTSPHAFKQKSCLSQSLTSQRPLYVQHLTRSHLSSPPQDSLSSPSCSSSSSHLSADSHNLHCAHVALPSQVHVNAKCPPYKQSLQTNLEYDDLPHSVNPEHCSCQSHKSQQCHSGCAKPHAPCLPPLSEQQGSHAKRNALSLSDSSTDHSSTSASVFQPSLRHRHREPPGAPDAAAVRVRSGPLSTEWLPDAVMLRVLTHLPVESLCRSARVCRRWYWLVWDPRLWQTVQLGRPWDEGSGPNVERALDALTARLCRDTPFVCLSLETLVLSGSPALGDAGLLTVARRCPELRRLEVSGCGEISNRGLLEVVTRCPNLEHLDVSDCPEITCVSLIPEASCQACPLHSRHLLLRHLDMSGCSGLTDEGLLAVARHCPRLARLYLRRCPGVADGGLRALARHCTALRELSLCDCPTATDAGLRDVAAALGPRLRYLSLAHCERVTDVTLRCLGRRCPGLRYLNARGCLGVTDRGLESLGRGCPRLRSLDVGRCPLVTDVGLEVLARGCPGLKRLGLKGCEGVSERGLRGVALCCPGLQLLSVQDCNLSPDTLRFVQQHCRRCVIEHTNLGCV